ncbi:unnamed protein product [Blepharisma stoltei]|uniref:GH18 domain-containing protein n=1 Tax=Blepharisma stoltei TaxID=1481888 RepID=A0AAU9K259_9CILI|nr:unnamed protein product [Blepharisma stoltei]
MAGQILGKVLVAYFVNWAIYERHFEVFNIDLSMVTHLNYAFAQVDYNGVVSLTDPWADEQRRYLDRGDSWNDPPGKLYGSLGQLYKLKVTNRHLKTGISIGGWTLSGPFSAVCADPAKRRNFIQTSLTILMDYGFDYIDIDWEYPVSGGLDSNTRSTNDINNFISLLKEFNQAFDRVQSTLGFRPFITLAAPAAKQNYQHWNFVEMSKYVEFFNIMTYDFAGSWSPYAWHMSNLYRSTNGFSVNETITDLMSSMNLSPDKICMGIPLYGRGYSNCNGLGSSFNGLPTQGLYEAGIYDYKVIPPDNFVVYFDDSAKAPYSYSSSQRVLITHDNPLSVGYKLQYLHDKSLRGVMFWETSGDRPQSSVESLIRISYDQIKSSIDSTLNHVVYPTSKFTNILHE